MAVTGEIKILGYRIRRALKANISENENVLFCLVGASKGQAIAALDKRLIVLKSGFMAGATFGCRVTSIYYKDITSIEINTGMMRGVIEICTPSYQGNKNKDFWADIWSWNSDRSPWQVSNCIPIDKSNIKAYKPYLDKLQELITKAKEINSTTSSTSKDIASQIEKLDKLYKQGTLTRQEFEQAKKKLFS